MQIKLDPSIDDAPHTIEIPAMTIEGREQCGKIIAMLQKHAAALWPKPRLPRRKKPDTPDAPRAYAVPQKSVAIKK